MELADAASGGPSTALVNVLPINLIGGYCALQRPQRERFPAANAGRDAQLGPAASRLRRKGRVRGLVRRGRRPADDRAQSTLLTGIRQQFALPVREQGRRTTAWIAVIRHSNREVG
ncbi:hypothetical protein FPZ12_014065 [Amycolatopsis acidicola]|uniref:Uncharacterized protein n=1 Tax=Amycolatopsis acidicola TaxID=2596893 RepID=A0A5N0V5E2_9PSEU|nr:hypothetical protein [Amycolatopsis acidicola]KAA9161629.1 hypothetical protein FPZ12_014065 [Amycolatopsis acidicola]